VFASAASGTNGVWAGYAPAACILVNRNNGYTLLRCNLHGTGDGQEANGTNIIIHSCYIHHLIQFYGPTGAVSHNDCVQASDSGCSNVQIVNNHMEARNPVTGTAGNSSMQIVPSSSGRTQSNVLIEHNYFNGGGYTLSGYGTTNLAAMIETNFRIMNNRFGLDNLFGPSYPNRDSRIAWSNNVWDVSGTTGSGDTVTAGQSIP
jgi:hypothetical protein